MKTKLMYALSALVMVAMMLATSCSNDGDESSPSINISQEFANLSLESGAIDEEIQFVAATDWNITSEEITKAAPSWLRVSPMSGKAGNVTLKVSVDKNTTEKERICNLIINSGGDPYTITVTQIAGVPEVAKNAGITINGLYKPFTGIAKMLIDNEPNAPKALCFSGIYSQANVENGTFIQDWLNDGGGNSEAMDWGGIFEATNMTNVDLTKTPDPNHMFMVSFKNDEEVYSVLYNRYDTAFEATYYDKDQKESKLTLESGTISYNLTGDKVSVDLDVKLSGGHSIQIVYDGDAPDVSGSDEPDEPVAVEEITLETEKLFLNVDEKKKIEITAILPETASNKEVEWRSANENVITVDQEGNVTAVSAGEAFVYVKAKDGSSTEASCYVTVEEAEPGDAKDVTITFNANGGAGTMQAQVVKSGVVASLNSSSFTRTNYSFSHWNTKSDGTGVTYSDKATITTSENIIFYAQWKCTMDASMFVGYWEANSISGTYSNMPLSLETLKTLGIDPFAFQFNADGTGTSPLASGSAYWSISDDDLTITAANIPATLNIDAISATDMTLSSSSLTLGALGSATDVVITLVKTTALDPTVSIVSVTLNKSALSLIEGESEALTATINPTDATNKDVEWKSSNPAVATVVEGKITAVKAGAATITVTTTDGSKEDTCDVTVVAPIGITPPSIGSGGAL